jgi:hypothetical protein
MIEYKLSTFVRDHSQRLAAEILGVTAQAVHNALRKRRDIRIVDHGDGVFSGYEVRPLSMPRKITEPKRAA